MHAISTRLSQASTRLRTAGPYLVLLLLPGGSVFALALLLYRRGGHVHAARIQRAVGASWARIVGTVASRPIAWARSLRPALQPVRAVGRERP